MNSETNISRQVTFEEKISKRVEQKVSKEASSCSQLLSLNRDKSQWSKRMDRNSSVYRENEISIESCLSFRQLTLAVSCIYIWERWSAQGWPQWLERRYWRVPLGNSRWNHSRWNHPRWTGRAYHFPFARTIRRVSRVLVGFVEICNSCKSPF